jgi:outer membrane protein OmpA-like peptidoglycan-associated protein
MGSSRSDPPFFNAVCLMTMHLSLMKRLSFFTALGLSWGLVIACQTQSTLQGDIGYSHVAASEVVPPQPMVMTSAPRETMSATPAPPPEFKTPEGAQVAGSKVDIPGHVLFETGKSKLLPSSEPKLAQLKKFLIDNPQITQLRIEGHTDNEGQEKANIQLSGDRALACVRWLEVQGIKRGRLMAVGFGQERPVVANDSEDNKSKNRRIEFHIAVLNGKRFLGKDPTGGGLVFQ